MSGQMCLKTILRPYFRSGLDHLVLIGLYFSNLKSVVNTLIEEKESVLSLLDAFLAQCVLFHRGTRCQF